VESIRNTVQSATRNAEAHGATQKPAPADPGLFAALSRRPAGGVSERVPGSALTQ